MLKCENAKMLKIINNCLIWWVMAYVFVGEPLMKDKEWKVKSGGGSVYTYFCKKR